MPRSRVRRKPRPPAVKRAAAPAGPSAWRRVALRIGEARHYRPKLPDFRGPASRALSLLIGRPAAVLWRRAAPHIRKARHYRLQPVFLPVIECASDHVRRYWYLPLLVAVLVAGAYISLVVGIDNTNLGTSNGLWKAPVVFAWGHGATAPLDTGGILFADAYGHLARLIPDSLLRYGTPAPDVTFRKMAILNAIFGGLASGLVFLLALRFTGSLFAAAAISLMHAGAGFVLLNSINSEDIIPAYVCFLGATVCFFEFLHFGGLRLFAVSAFLLALATLFHWTVMAPALAAFGAVFALLLLKRKRYFWAGAAWLFLFLVLLKVLVFLALPRLHISVWTVLYPTKANAGGWVGLFGEKAWYFLAGIGNYFSGASNIGNYRAAFASKSIFHSMLLSWAVLSAALASCFLAIVRRPGKSGRELLAVFAIALFVVGEAGAVYSQPSDPQMQIEPMFAIVPGAILLARRRTGATGLFWQRSIVGTLAVAAIANGAWNVHLMRADSGQDSKAVAAIEEMNRLFPKDRTMIVFQGFEGWVTWQYELLWQDHFDEYLQRTVDLARPFTMNRGIGGPTAAAMVTKHIDAAFAKGLRVVAASFWTMPPEEEGGSFTTVTHEADARLYVSILKKEYRIGKQWDTKLGPFVELLPAKPPSQP